MRLRREGGGEAKKEGRTFFKKKGAKGKESLQTCVCVRVCVAWELYSHWVVTLANSKRLLKVHLLDLEQSGSRKMQGGDFRAYHTAKVSIHVGKKI